MRRPDATKPGQGLVATRRTLSEFVARVSVGAATSLKLTSRNASCPAPEDNNAAAPSKGPKVKPNPNAAPISAMPLARFCKVVQSAI